MEKRVKFLRILLYIWLALGGIAMLYVLFITKKSNILLAMIFIAGFAAIAIPLRSASDKLKDAQKKDE